MNIQPVGNRDHCGKCKVRHGGNNHLCDVHGVVSEGCCTTSCNRADYVAVGYVSKAHPHNPPFKTVLRSDVNLVDAKLDPPFKHQDDGNGKYKPEYIERYLIN